MVKKAKAFSKIFTASEVKKGLLASSSRDEDDVPERSETANSFDDDFHLSDDFPIASSKAKSDEDDIFAEKKSSNHDAFGFPDDSGTGGFDEAGAFAEGEAFPVNGGDEDDEDEGDDDEAADAFETDAFASGTPAFADAGDFGTEDNQGNDGFGEFPMPEPEGEEGGEDAEDDDDTTELNDEEDDLPLPAVDDAAFFASFSNLDKAQEASLLPKDGKKKKKRITKLFNKKKDNSGFVEPVSRCAEIVVDKSKIPTTKVDMELANGKLVTPKQQQQQMELGPPEEEGGPGGEKDKEGKEKSKSKYKSWKKTLVKKVRGPSSKERLDDEEAGDGEENQFEPYPEPLQEASENQEEGDEEEDDDDEDDEDGKLGDGSNRQSQAGIRQRDRVRSRRRGPGDPLTSDTQRRSRRRESRMDGKRVNSDGGAGSRLASKGEEVRMRRSRTEEVGGGRSSRNDELTASGSRRRHTVMDRSMGSPHRRGAKPTVSSSDGLDESKRKSDSSGWTRTSSSSMTDGSSRNRKSDSLDGTSSRPRTSDLVDGSSRHRSSGSRRHRDSGGGSGRKPMRKSKSIDDSVPSPRKGKSGDGLSTSAHIGLRRNNTAENGMTNRRAQSSRHLLKKDESLKESSHRLSSRDRLRRAPRSERHLTKKEDMEKKQAVGKLFGGGFGDEGGGAPRRRAGSDGDMIEDIVEEENESEMDETESERPGLDGSALDGSKVMAEESDNKPRESSAADSLGVALAGKTLSKDDVEKLIRTVALQAKDAKDDDDLENIVMEALGDGGGGGKSAAKLGLSLDLSIDESYLDASAQSDSNNDENWLHDKARDYVQMFLKKHGAGDAKQHHSKRQSSNDYTSALHHLGSNDSQENKEESERKSTGKDIKGSSGHGATRTKKNAKKASSGSHHDVAKRDKRSQRSRKSPGNPGDVAWKRDGGTARNQSSTKTDFSNVASKLEAKAESRNRTRVRAPPVTAVK